MSLEKGFSSWGKIFFFMLSGFHSFFEVLSNPTSILNCTPNHWQDSTNPIPVYSITMSIALPPLLQTKHHHFSLLFPEKYKLGWWSSCIKHNDLCLITSIPSFSATSSQESEFSLFIVYSGIVSMLKVLELRTFLFILSSLLNPHPQ